MLIAKHFSHGTYSQKPMTAFNYRSEQGFLFTIKAEFHVQARNMTVIQQNKSGQEDQPHNATTNKRLCSQEEKTRQN